MPPNKTQPVAPNTTTLYDERLTPPRGWRIISTVIPIAIIVLGFLADNVTIKATGITFLLGGLIGLYLGRNARITVTTGGITFKLVKAPPALITGVYYLNKNQLRQNAPQGFFGRSKVPGRPYMYGPWWLKEGVLVTLSRGDHQIWDAIVVGSRHAQQLTDAIQDLIKNKGTKR